MIKLYVNQKTETVYLLNTRLQLFVVIDFNGAIVQKDNTPEFRGFLRSQGVPEDFMESGV
jgi:hypothetical protein